MINDKEIIERIRKTKLFNEKLKQDIIFYFKFLNQIQKNNLIQALDIEKNIIKDFLLTLKDKELLEFEEIKTNIDFLHRKDRLIKELQEKVKDENDINKLLDNLELV